MISDLKSIPHHGRTHQRSSHAHNRTHTTRATHTHPRTHTHTHPHTHTQNQLLISDLKSITRQTRDVWLAADMCGAQHSHTHANTKHTHTYSDSPTHKHTATHMCERCNRGTHCMLTHIRETHTHTHIHPLPCPTSNERTHQRLISDLNATHNS